MAIVLILLRKSLLTFWRSKAAVSITFLVPIVLIYLFGHVFNLYPHKGSNTPGIPLAVVNLSAEPAARQLLAALREEKALQIIDGTTTADRTPRPQTETAETMRTGKALQHLDTADGTPRPLTEADVRQGMKDNRYRFALILPADLLPDNSFGLHLKFLTNPRNEIETQMVNGLLQKTIFSQVPELLGQSLQKAGERYLGGERLQHFHRTMADTIADHFGGDREKLYQQMSAGDAGFSAFKTAPLPATTPAPEGHLRRLDATAPAAESAAPEKSGAAGDIFSRIVRIETEQVAGKEVTNPMAARTVGGYAIMFLLMAVSGSATSLFEEKSTGIFQRLLSAPVRPAHILWARFLFGVILGLVQITALLLAGHFFFALDIWSHAAALLAVGVSAAAACSAFGMLVVAIAPNPHAASGIATLVVISMSAVGGAWFPVTLMPEMVQRFSRCTLVYWAVEAFTDVLWAGSSLLAVLPKIGILNGIALGVGLLATWLIRRGSMFA